MHGLGPSADPSVPHAVPQAKVQHQCNAGHTSSCPAEGPCARCRAQCRMQVGRQLPGDGKGARFKGYSSTAACVRHLVRTEGLRGLTRGVGATMLRETPGNAIFFLRRRAVPCTLMEP